MNPAVVWLKEKLTRRRVIEYGICYVVTLALMGIAFWFFILNLPVCNADQLRVIKARMAEEQRQMNQLVAHGSIPRDSMPPPSVYRASIPPGETYGAFDENGAPTCRGSLVMGPTDAMVSVIVTLLGCSILAVLVTMLYRIAEAFVLGVCGFGLNLYRFFREPPRV